MTCRTRLMAIAGTTALILPFSAAHAQCIKQVDDMAASLGLSTSLPEPADLAGEPGAASGEDAVSALAESQGVIAPPDTGGEMPVLEPGAGQTSDMPTAPDIEATPSPEGEAAPDAEMDTAAAMTQVEALLTAAREAANSGDEDACLNRLQEAAALAAANRLPVPE
jgi:hypothetical protein